VAACRRTSAKPRACSSSPPTRETPSGQVKLGFFYEQGRGGLTKDEREAARLYKLAADQGNAWAQAALTRLGRQQQQEEQLWLTCIVKKKPAMKPPLPPLSTPIPSIPASLPDLVQPVGFWDCLCSLFDSKWNAENKRRGAFNLARYHAIQNLSTAIALEERKRLYATLTLSIDELRALPSTRFEDMIALLFTRLGYDVKQTPYSNDFGRDAIMTKDGKKYLLECKRYTRKGMSGRPPLQKLHSAMVTDKADGGFFVTSGGFSEPGKRFAKENNITLIDAEALTRLMFESNPLPNTEYRSSCQQCGDIVQHDLQTPQQIETCKNGHEVKPSLGNIDWVIKSGRPRKDGSPRSYISPPN
jgi:restriction system protein